VASIPPPPVDRNAREASATRGTVRPEAATCGLNALLHTTRGAPSRESEDLGDPSNAFPPRGWRAPSVTTTRRREQAEDGIVDGHSVACRSASPRIGSEVVRELLIIPFGENTQTSALDAGCCSRGQTTPMW